jgi:ankyrin repeat protein
MAACITARDPGQRQWGIRALVWVMNARRGLSEAELAAAVAVDQKWNFFDEFNDAVQVPSRKDFAELCLGLITLDENGIYRTVNSSLKDHLLSPDLQIPPELTQLLHMQRNAEIYLAESCITYLKFPNSESSPVATQAKLLEFQRRNPLFEYAATYCGKHIAAVTHNKMRETTKEFLAGDGIRNLVMQQFMSSRGLHRFPWRGECSKLHFLALYNLVELARELDANDGFLEYEDGFGWLPLDYALMEQSYDIYHYFIPDAKDDVAVIQLDRESPAEERKGTFSTRWSNLIISFRGLDPPPKDSTVAVPALDPIFLATRHGPLSVLHFLLRNGFDVDGRGLVGRTPLLFAAQENLTDVAIALLRAGANPNLRSRDGVTALHLAAYHSNVELVHALLSHGAMSSRCDGIWKWEHLEDSGFSGLTPLHLAAAGNNEEIIEALYRRSVSIDTKSDNGSTPLHIAAIVGALPGAKRLVQLGALLDLRDEHGQTAVCNAARYSHRRTLKFLVEAGGEISACSNDGRTALHYAVEARNLKLTRLILGISGANVNAEIDQDLTSLDIAARTEMRRLPSFSWITTLT